MTGGFPLQRTSNAKEFHCPYVIICLLHDFFCVPFSDILIDNTMIKKTQVSLILIWSLEILRLDYLIIDLLKGTLILNISFFEYIFMANSNNITAENAMR